ncbi:MAG: transposase [Sandaracinaceae bacterium]
MLEQTRRMFKLWRRVRDGTLLKSGDAMPDGPIRTEIERLLEEAAGSPCTRTGKAQALLKYRDALWTFVDVEGVAPTNNEAERALRHAVILRKLSFKTQSDRGSRFVERMLSAVDTLRKRERDVMGFLMDALAAKDTSLRRRRCCPSRRDPVERLPPEPVFHAATGPTEEPLPMLADGPIPKSRSTWASSACKSHPMRRARADCLRASRRASHRRPER